MPADDIMQAGNYRYEALGVYINQEAAHAQTNRFNGDLAALSENLANIASARAEQQALANLHSELVAMETPRYQAPLTSEEKQAKPLEKMTWQDSWEITNTSKHGVDENAFRAGMQEVMNRRNRGE